MGEISFNTSGLGEITDYYQNEFDAKFKDLKEKMEATMVDLGKTWEGNEATMANNCFEKIRTALGEIEFRSNDFRRILSSKVEGFQEVTQRTAGRLQEREDIRF